GHSASMHARKRVIRLVNSESGTFVIGADNVPAPPAKERKDTRECRRALRFASERFDPEVSDRRSPAAHIVWAFEVHLGGLRLSRPVKDDLLRLQCAYFVYKLRHPRFNFRGREHRLGHLLEKFREVSGEVIGAL
ncbi:MAG TPA: hypothetical protein PLV33_13655, partial [Opitutaceae bacterium]|nr:hypothetical protein [Opitutaceae bacterium]